MHNADTSLSTARIDITALRPGAVIDHRQRRTLTKLDNTWITLLTLNTAPHFDDTAPNYRQFGGVLMNSCITLGVVQGICLQELWNVTHPNMPFGEIRLLSPVFANDTISAQSVIVAQHQDYGDHEGASTEAKTSGYNQKGVKVIEFSRFYAPFSTQRLHDHASARTVAVKENRPTSSLDAPKVGPYFEDFKIGDRYDHGTGRTMLADESIWYSLLHMNSNAHFVDHAIANEVGLQGPLVNDIFVLSTITGISVKHTTQNATANLGWRKVVFEAPVLPGDTIFAASEVLQTRRSKSHAGQGIVTVATTGKNQLGTGVLSFERTFMIPCRP